MKRITCESSSVGSHVASCFGLFGLLSLLPAVAPTAGSAAVLVPGTTFEVRLDADTAAGFTVELRDGQAARLELTQKTGFVDLQLHDERGTEFDVRTEAGVDGHIDAPLIASGAGEWSVVISSRRDKGSAMVELRLSVPHEVTPSDAFAAAAFRSYVDAEQLRRANYRETVVNHRTVDTDDLTRAAYAAAAAQYGLAGDGCGERRTAIGVARMYAALGNYAAARSAGESALTFVCGADVAEQAQVFKTIGMATAYQGEFAASAEASEQALALYRRTGDLRYQGIVLGNLSAVYMQLGATDRALDAANQALEAATATRDGQGIVFSRKSIAAIHLARGELARALEDYRRTLADIAVTAYPMVEGETWNDLGITYDRMGDAEQSLRAFTRAHGIWKAMHNRVGDADTLINQAEVLLKLSRSRAARVGLQRALAIARADGLKSVETRALRGLGSVCLALGQLRSARRYFASSRDSARATGEMAAESSAVRALGALDSRQGHAVQARRKDAVALALARTAGDQDGQATTLAQLAQHDAAGGELQSARYAIEQALAIAETQRGQINDPGLRTGYFSSRRVFADTQIDILMRLDERFPRQGYAAAGLIAAERARARSLQDMFAERSIQLSTTVPAQLRSAERAAEEGLSAAAFQLGRLTSAAPADQRQLLVTAVDTASHRLDEVRGQIRHTNPRYADLVRPAPLDIDEIQRAQLTGDTAILEYWLGSRQSYVWILTRRSLRVVRLASRMKIERLAAHLGVLLGARHEPPADGFEGLAAIENQHAEAVELAAAALGKAIMPPSVTRNLPLKIALVGDGNLQELPLGMLPGDRPASRLGDTHEVSYLPSLATLKWLRRPTAGDSRPASLAVFASPILRASTTSAAEPTVAPLPYSRLEAESIAEFFPKDKVWLALDGEASRSRALAADWHPYSIVHFATHAVVDRRRPELSRIVLSLYDANGQAQDGSLRMNDIYELDMPVELVVLSGCDTAAGRAIDAEGVFSLSRAFLFAGARHVVASLWPVDDQATAAFMREFYRGMLVEHMPAASALRFAGQSLSQDKRWGSPYYWGGFVLQGDWN